MSSERPTDRNGASATDSPRFNVDERDVQNFSSYADDWWNADGVWKCLHDMNQVRVPFVRDGLITPGKCDQYKYTKSNILKGFKILDVGCGAGILSEALANLGAEVVGLDPSENLIRTANEHIADQDTLHLTYMCDLIEDHAAKNPEKYDAVVASEVVEHVVSKRSFLKGCVDAIKPGGSIFITTFSKTWLSWFFGKLCGEYLCCVLPRNTHIYNQFITPADVSKILREFNCETKLVKGFRYEFYRRVFKFQYNAQVEYALHAIKNTK